MDFLGESLSGGNSHTDGHGDIFGYSCAFKGAAEKEEDEDSDGNADLLEADTAKSDAGTDTESNAAGDSYGVTKAADTNMDTRADGDQYFGADTNEHATVDSDSGADKYIEAHEYAGTDKYIGSDGNEYCGSADEYTGSNSNALLPDAGDACANPDGLSDDGADTDAANSVGLGEG